MEIIGYQIAILAGIVIATLLFGKVGMFVVVTGAVIWTLVMVFTTPLMLLQFVTIVVAFVIAITVSSSTNFKDTQVKAWVVLILGIGAIVWFNTKDYKQSSQPTNPPAPPIVGTPIGSTTPPSTSAALPSVYERPQQATLSPAMEQVIARLEAEFPQFSQTSPSFNRGMVDLAIAGQGRYIAKGFSPELALEKSAREVIATNYSHLAPANQTVTAQQQGIFWECISPNGVREISKSGCRPGQRSVLRN